MELYSLVEALKAVAFEAGAYKITLDCSEKNKPFYGKVGII